MTVVELRQYTLHPGRRDELIELFDREFVETQEACGMRLLGQFRDLDHPDRFVWLRSFASMPARLAALTAFYSGPVWKAHSAAANATMVDVSDVLLLRPDGPLLNLPAERDSLGPAGLIVATVTTAGQPLPQPTPLARYSTLDAENTFPALAVREGVNVSVSVHRGTVPDTAHLQQLRLAPTDRSLLR